MTSDRRQRLARTAAVAAAVMLAVAIAALLTDYVVASVRAPRDAASVLALQRRVESDRGAASLLAAEQDRITRSRQARKRRDDALAIVAIAAASLFVAARKWRTAMAGRRPVVSVRAEALTHGESQHESQGLSPSLPLVGQGTSPGRHSTPSPAGQGLSRSSTQSPVGQGFSPDQATQPKPVGQGFSPDRATQPQPVGQGFSPDIDLAFVDQAVAAHGRTTEAAIPLLQAIQTHYRYLPDEALRRICELTDVTPAQIAGTSTFYAHFRRSPLGDHVVRVCHGTACHVSGARQITEELRRRLGIPEGADTDPGRRFTIDEVACLGCCSLAPVLMVDEQTAGRLTPATAVAALDLARETEPA